MHSALWWTNTNKANATGAMSVAAYTNGDCLTKSKANTPTAEDIRYVQDQEYSDGGCPTLPRPKVIIAVPRPGSPWSVYEASLLQTVPVRLGATARIRAETASPVLTPKPLYNVEEQAANVKSVAGKGSALRLVNKEEKLARGCNSSQSGIRGDSGHSCKPTGTTTQAPGNPPLQCKSTMSASSPKVKKPRLPTRAISFSFGSTSSDKKRRSINLFGTLRKGLDRGTTGRDDSLLDASRSGIVAPDSPILLGRRKSRTLPSSLRTFGNGDGNSLRQRCILEECDVYSSSSTASSSTASSPMEDSRWSAKIHPNGTSTVGRNHRLRSYQQDLEAFKSQDQDQQVPSTRHQRPSLPSSSSSPTRCDSPLTNPSTASATSPQESMDSLTLSARSDTPPSATRQSPNLTRSSRPQNALIDQPTSSAVLNPPRERKLSDPISSTPETSPQLPLRSAERSTRGVKLKKGHTFCVSQTRSRESPGWREMRHHVVRFLLETEQSYVQSLKTIIKVYFEPLKRPQAAGLADPSLVKDIFYLIPEIYSLHEKFLQQVIQRVEHWHPLQRIGDLFVNTFSKCQLMDIYSKFIGNFMRAKAATEIAKQARPVFAKFLEQRAKDSQGKLSLDDLLIKPVQRIPRYVLFIKDLLKHTTPSHPDHSPLQQALGELTMLAERVNASERERGRLNQQKELLAAVDGLALLLKSQSSLVRYDMTTEIKGSVQKRDRFLILYSDVVVCAAARRKTTGFKRSSLINLNSLLPEAMRYKIKWHVPLTDLSLIQGQALLSENQRQNALEKMLENMKEDESVLQQVLELSNGLQRPHQPLVSLLKEMLSEVKEGAVKKREELENLAQEEVRIDLVSHKTTSPLQYSILFPSQRIRNSWEADFLATKQAADRQAPPSVHVAPPTSPPPVQDSVSHHLQFLHPILLQSGRVGIELTCSTVGLPIDCDSSNCLWVCCSDGYGGQVSFLDLQPSTQPQLVANITISDSKILCIAAISSTHESTPISTVGAEMTTTRDFHILEEEEEGEKEATGTDSIDSSISDTSSELSHASFSRTESSASEYQCTQEGALLSADEGSGGSPHPLEGVAPRGSDEGGDDISHSESTPKLMMQSPENGLGGVPVTTDSRDPAEGIEDQVFSFKHQSRSVDPSHLSAAFCRVRSNSAPPDPDRILTNGSNGIHPSIFDTSHQNPTTSVTKVWGPLTLRPSSTVGENSSTGSSCSMWLGTQAGNLFIYSAGNNLRSRSNRRTMEMPAAVHCIRSFEGLVYVGLGNGTLAVFDPQDPASPGPRHSIPVGTGPVLCCVPVLGQLWASSGGTLYLVRRKEKLAKSLATLPSGQHIHNVVAVESGVWVSARDSPIVHLYHASSATLIMTIDCTRAVMDLLRGYDAIIRQHKSSDLKITALLPTPTSLLVGTSAGAILALPLVQIPEPCPLLHPPCPTPLSLGHVDPVHFLTSIQREGATLVLSGGNGYEDFASTETSGEIPETASCLLVWEL